MWKVIIFALAVVYSDGEHYAKLENPLSFTIQEKNVKNLLKMIKEHKTFLKNEKQVKHSVRKQMKWVKDKPFK